MPQRYALVSPQNVGASQYTDYLPFCDTNHRLFVIRRTPWRVVPGLRTADGATYRGDSGVTIVEVVIDFHDPDRPFFGAPATYHEAISGAPVGVTRDPRRC